MTISFQVICALPSEHGGEQRGQGTNAVPGSYRPFGGTLGVLPITLHRASLFSRWKGLARDWLFCHTRMSRTG
jgi:hypothetical protein